MLLFAAGMTTAGTRTIRLLTLLAALSAGTSGCKDDDDGPSGAIDAATHDAATADAAPSVRPNVLVVLMDDQSRMQPDYMPFVAATDWIKFANSSVNVAWCCPSRSTTLTGQFSHHHGVETLQGSLFDPTSTVATWLQAAGYRTSLVGKYLNGYPFDGVGEVPPGWSDWHAFTNVAYYNYKLSHNGNRATYGDGEEDYSTDVLGRIVVDFIEETTDQPWFMFFAPKSPHSPLIPAPRHEGVFADFVPAHSPSFNEEDVSDKPAWVRALPMRDEEEMVEHRRRMLEMNLAVDDALIEIYHALQATGQLERTVIIFTSDNGYSLGEHRWKTKRCEYDECTQVPLYILMPGQAGRTIEQAVVNADLAPTIAELAGVQPGLEPDGLSLVPLITGDGRDWPREGVLIHFVGDAHTPEHDTDDVERERVVPTFWGIRTPTHKYVEILGNGGASVERELYDLALDPYELENVAGEDAYAEIQAHLDQLLASQTPPTPTAGVSP